MDKLFIKGLDRIFFIVALKAAQKFLEYPYEQDI